MGRGLGAGNLGEVVTTTTGTGFEPTYE